MIVRNAYKIRDKFIFWKFPWRCRNVVKGVLSVEMRSVHQHDTMVTDSFQTDQMKKSSLPVAKDIKRYFSLRATVSNVEIYSGAHVKNYFLSSYILILLNSAMVIYTLGEQYNLNEIDLTFSLYNLLRKFFKGRNV